MPSCFFLDSFLAREIGCGLSGGNFSSSVAAHRGNFFAHELSVFVGGFWCWGSTLDLTHVDIFVAYHWPELRALCSLSCSLLNH